LDTWSLVKVQHFMVDHDLMWSLLAGWEKGCTPLWLICKKSLYCSRQQDRVLATKSSQQDGRQFMGSGQNIYLPAESPCESSPKPSPRNCVEDICLVV
jgi:hypothetical protein